MSLAYDKFESLWKLRGESSKLLTTYSQAVLTYLKSEILLLGGFPICKNRRHPQNVGLTIFKTAPPGKVS